MFLHGITHILEHALIDSLKVLLFTILIFIILSFIDDKLTNLFKRHKKISPIIGAGVGLLPQCSFSVVAADLYLKRHISIGCLFAVFFACSDEALPILFSNLNKAIYIIPLLLLKFIFGFILGFLLDAIYTKKEDEHDHNVSECEHSHSLCGHDTHNSTKINKHLVHPLIHSFKIFIYVLAVNIIFGIIIHLIGEENITSFLSQSKYLTPLVSALVGLIPNCSSSVLLTTLFTSEYLPFGAMFTGLCVNAGLGIVYLLKNRKSWKDILVLVSTLLISSIIIGYVIILVMELF